MLEDTSKFQPINQDNTEQPEKKLCLSVDYTKASTKLPKPICDYNPGRGYCTIERHNPGSPHRATISRMSSPTNLTAKTLNSLLNPQPQLQLPDMCR